jgi:DNA polymerase III subunit epsilon
LSYLARTVTAVQPHPPQAPAPVPAYIQESFDALLADEGAAQLRTTTFVVLDLETTGGTPEGCGITEIGAVRVCGGEPLGEFGTLVNPGEPIPPFITVLTGITQAMLLPAPKLEEALPAFLEFAKGAVWVAHNAPYDIGFLKAACAKLGYPWPRPVVLDTAALARRALTTDEVANRKLGTLAAFFGARTPTHRALDDARATVDVLHGLFARLGDHRVFTLGDAVEFQRAVTPTQRRKRHLADNLPDTPGVYVFRAADGRPLYVGKSGTIATRVKSYFTAAEKRARISEMLAAAERVEAIECAHGLEAEVRELRLIAAHKPPYNRRSKYPERVHWLKLTSEAYPRLSIVRQLGAADTSYLGPFASSKAAEFAAHAVYEALPLRQCSLKLSPRNPVAACALAELGRCPAPCEHRVSPADYQALAAEPFHRVTTESLDPVVARLLARIRALADAQRYEDAATARGRLVVLLRTAIRLQRLRSLTSIAELVAARPAAGGGWELVVIRHGRLVAAGCSPRGVHPRATIDTLLATAETVRPGPGPTPCASAEETERILAWLERDDSRLVRTTDGWALPAAGAARHRALLAMAERASTRPIGQ